VPAAAAYACIPLLRERVATTTPEWAEGITGISAARIRLLAREMGHTALRDTFDLPISWTDAWGKRHPTTQGRPVAFQAMRGLAAHSNDFQTVRALAVLMRHPVSTCLSRAERRAAPKPAGIPSGDRAMYSSTEALS
jgi:anaerobic selenocysteine-containing dehydrogenase